MSKNNEFYSSDLIEQIKNNTELQLNIIQQFIPQAKPNKKFKLHDEKTPSSILKLHEGKYWIKNFGGSDKSKDCFNIAQEALGCDMPELLRYLKKIFSIESTLTSESSQIIRTAFEKQVYAIKCNSTPVATKYAKDRGIDTESFPKKPFYQNNGIDGNADAIVFFDKDEKLINKRYLNPSGGQRYNNKGCLDGAIYDVCFNADSDKIYIVEGAINSLSLEGIESSIAIFSTANNITANLLSSYITNKHVILAFDNDKAGNEASKKLYNSILESNIEIQSIKRCVFPVNKDCNDLLQENQLKAFLSEKKNYKQLYPEFIADSTDENEDFKKKKYFIRNSRYFVKRFIRGKLCDVEISNFVMKILYFLPGDELTSIRIFHAQNSDGESKYFTLSSKDMNKSSLNGALRNKGGFSFHGTFEELEYIYQDLYRCQNEMKGFGKYFLQPDGETHVFNNGILYKDKFIPVNKLGTVELKGQTLYFPECDSIVIKKGKGTDKEIEDKSYHFSGGHLNFKSWSKLFYSAYDDNAMFGIVFAVAALFRDIIGKNIRFFPHLYLFGDGGSGKSTFADFIIKLLGLGQIGIGASGTSTKGLLRHISSAKNGIIFLREFTADKEKTYLEILKLAYDLAFLLRAAFTNGLETIKIALSSAFIIDGNFIPSRWSALIGRIDILDFKNLKFNRKATSAKEELEGKSEKGLGNVLSEILKHREYFSVNFKKTFDGIFHEIKYDDKNTTDLTERGIKHVAMYLAVFTCLKDRLDFPFDYNELKAIVFQTAQKQSELLSRSGEINNFWITINTLKDRGKISDDSFRFREKDGKNILLVKFETLYNIYKEECILKQEECTDKNTLLGLLKNHKSKYPSWQGRKHTVYIKGWASGYTFEFEKLPLEKELWLK